MAASRENLTRREKVERRERAIIVAAQAVFMEHGYDGARISEIARRAQIAEGTLYIYYKTKADLAKALVSDFWEELTIGAQTAAMIKGDVYDRLRALAEFHLMSLIKRFDVVELTMSLRAKDHASSTSRDDLRQYVAVFDGIIQSGLDQGTFSAKTPLWIARDLFYGTLEYSARTILYQKKADPTDVIDNLIEVFKVRFGQEETRLKPEPGDPSVLDRLDAVVAKLEALSRN